MFRRMARPLILPPFYPPRSSVFVAIVLSIQLHPIHLEHHIASTITKHQGAMLARSTKSTMAVRASRNLATMAPRTLGSVGSGAPVFLEDMPAHTTAGPDRALLPSFTMSRSRGFLPRDDPLVRLPTGVPAFDKVEHLLEKMTLVQDDGSPGLLALGQFGQAVHQELCGAEADSLEKSVDEAIRSGNQDVMSALFRDLSFLVSSYLLEPVDLHFKATGTYTAGRDVLPRAVAVPFKKLADALGHFPCVRCSGPSSALQLTLTRLCRYMEYASSYALQNWKRVDPKGPIAYDNLRLIRAFENRAPSGSESGFM